MTEYEDMNQGQEKDHDSVFFADYERQDRCQSQPNELPNNGRSGCLQLDMAKRRDDFTEPKRQEHDTTAHK